MTNKTRLGAVLLLLLASAGIGPTLAADKKPAAERKRAPDAIRCVRMPVTGSLVQNQKVCMSNRDWDQQREDARNMQSLVCSSQGQCAGR